MRQKRYRRQKHRAKYTRLFNEHNGDSTNRFADFEILLAKLLALNPKYLQVMVEDLKVFGSFAPWTGDYHKALIHRAEMAILERTILK